MTAKRPADPEALARFMVDMSHELRTPMNGVLGTALPESVRGDCETLAAFDRGGFDEVLMDVQMPDGHGMDDYLSKPVVPAELVEILDTVVAAYGSHA